MCGPPDCGPSARQMTEGTLNSARSCRDCRQSQGAEAASVSEGSGAC